MVKDGETEKMIPGPYSICRISFPDEHGDAANYATIRYGYDTAEDAFDDILTVAEEEDLPTEDLVVIKFVDREMTDD